MPSQNLYHYCVVRADLPLGVMAAQLVHSAAESSPGNLPPGTFAVVLSVEGELQLLALEVRLRKAGIDFVSIREPDAPWNGQLMAIGIAPCYRSTVKKEVSNIPLLR